MLTEAALRLPLQFMYWFCSYFKSMQLPDLFELTGGFGETVSYCDRKGLPSRFELGQVSRALLEHHHSCASSTPALLLHSELQSEARRSRVSRLYVCFLMPVKAVCSATHLSAKEIVSFLLVTSSQRLESKLRNSVLKLDSSRLSYWASCRMKKSSCLVLRTGKETHELVLAEV